jgi:TfoX/Sxy family transcriptional regulator of competence genes
LATLGKDGENAVVMPYSESLAGRLRHTLAREKGIEEKKMFGGLGFLLHGNMLVGVWHDSLIVRVGPEKYQHALSEDHVQEFDIKGRPMRGWVVVEPDGLETDERLAEWVERAMKFVSTLARK